MSQAEECNLDRTTTSNIERVFACVLAYLHTPGCVLQYVRGQCCLTTAKETTQEGDRDSTRRNGCAWNEGKRAEDRYDAASVLGLGLRINTCADVVLVS